MAMLTHNEGNRGQEAAGSMEAWGRFLRDHDDERFDGDDYDPAYTGAESAGYPIAGMQDAEEGLPPGVTVTYCERGHRFFDGVHLVRGVGKRSVKVILRPFHGVKHWEREHSDEQLCVLAAKVASKNGWRKVVVAPDDYGYNDARVFNMDQFMVGNTRFGHQGKYLCSMGRGASWA